MSDEDKATRSEQGKKTKLVILPKTQESSGSRPVPELTVSPAPDHDHETFSARMDDTSIELETRIQEIRPEPLEDFISRGPYPGTATSPVDGSSIPEDTDQDGDMGPEDQDIGQGLIFPETISYRLQVKCDDILIDPLRKTLSLNDSCGYGKIRQEAIEVVDKLSQTPPNEGCLHFRGGHCIEVRNNEPRPQYAIANGRQWQDMCRKLLKDFTSGGIRHCELLITFEYSLLRLNPTDLDEASDSDADEATGVNEATLMSNRAQQLRLAHKVRLMLRENINGQQYLSRVDFEAITSRQIIQAVISNCKGLKKLNDNVKAELSQAIGERGKRLFTMFLVDQINMRCLRKLLDSGFHDTDLRRREGQPFTCCKRHNTQLQPESLAQRPIMFSVFGFVPGHFKVPWNWVIPVLPVAVDQNERSSDLSTTPSNAAADTKQDNITAEETRKASATLGEGAHSQVYQVRIDPSHNRISKNRDELFALKEITSMKHRPNAEESMLDEIDSYKSPHLTKRLVSWTQGNKYCILFPLAECNLANYMKRHDFSNEGINIVWLLEQFHGLADALVEIHTPKSKREEQISSTRHARSSSGQQQLSPSESGQDAGKGSYIGWHHDVKPENILYFSNTDTKQKTFQLCDYGSSKINKYRSHSDPTATSRGTHTYLAPELGSMSRPADTWALGCVFLEIVTWAIEGYGGVESFRKAREGKLIHGSETIDEAFWERLLDKSLQLRKKVTEHIQTLTKKAQNNGHDPFLDVLDLIIQMLDIDRDDRVKMGIVRQQLLSIVAKANLEQSTAALMTGGAGYANLRTSDMPFRSTSDSMQRATAESPPRSPKQSRIHQI